MSKFLFICTSNRDRSPTMERYFRELYPMHEYKSAGINRYFTKMKGTHYLTQQDLVWSDIVVFAEDIHQQVTNKNFHLPADKAVVVLNLGEYEQGDVNEEYLSAAHDKLKHLL